MTTTCNLQYKGSTQTQSAPKVEEPIDISERIEFVARSLGVGRELNTPDGQGQIDADWRVDWQGQFLFLGERTQVRITDGEPAIIMADKNVLIPAKFFSLGLQARIRELFAAHAAA